MGALPLAALLALAPGASQHVTATLLAETDSVQPGRPLVVGLRLSMAPEWHTYWKNPGDAGLATRVEWRLPEGFSAAPLQWPRPERMPADPLMSYGYQGEVLLLTEIKTPAQLAAREIPLSARVSWLECREACFPGKATLELTLPVSTNPRPSPQQAEFRRSRERMPRAATGLKLDAALRGSSLFLTVGATPPPKQAYFFADTAGTVEHGAPQKAQPEGGLLRLTLERAPNAPPPSLLTGVLELDDRAYEIHLPLRAGAASK
jgi:thiol:disulfide interchange protein DsbD